MDQHILIASASSEASDEPAHMRSLDKVFASRIYTKFGISGRVRHFIRPLAPLDMSACDLKDSFCALAICAKSSGAVLYFEARWSDVAYA